jgi:hypothetical protein
LSSDSFSCFVGLDPNNQYHSLIWWPFPVLCFYCIFPLTYCFLA